jgi:polyisoprenoid-binding protein YceI
VAAIGSFDGTWKVTSGSQVGYRVSEILLGQSHVAVGRTSSIQGSFALSATTVESGSFTADMRTITSDQSRRDEQFNGRIMETSTYPTATFVLDGPVELGSLPADGVTRTVRVPGTLPFLLTFTHA